MLCVDVYELGIFSLIFPMFSFVSFFNAQSYSYCSVMSSESRSIFKSIYTFKKFLNVHVYAHVKIHVHVRVHVHINIHASCPCLVHINIYVHVHFHVHVHWHVQWIDVDVQYMNMSMLHILCSGPFFQVLLVFCSDFNNWIIPTIQ